MSSVPTLADSWVNATNGTSFSGGISYTPPTDRLVLVVTAVVDDGGSVPAQTLSGCGMTWSVYTDGVTAAARAEANGRLRIRVFRPTAGTPSAGQLTIDTGAVTCERAICAIIEVTETANVDAVQVVTNTANNASPSCTLAALADAANLLLGIFAGRNPLQGFTLGSGWSSLANGAVESDTRLVVEYAYNDTSVDGTWAGNCNWAGVAVEIDNVPPAAGVTPHMNAYRRRRAA